MVEYSELGYSTLDDFLHDFKASLLKTTHTYDFFVDWKKVTEKVADQIIGLGMLNSLTLAHNDNDRKELLRKLLKEHPAVVSLFPILLAVRESEIQVADMTEQIIYKEFDFSKPLEKNKIEDMVVFCEKTGIIDLFGTIKDSYSYVLGAEVGLDSNARKNRSGEVFKNLVDHLLTITENSINKKSLRISHKPEIKLSDLGITHSEKKQVDFMIYSSGKAIAACEANVYNVQGSKPTEIVRSYSHLNKILTERGLKFFWFTDGPGWNVMWNAFEDGVKNVDYVMNYTTGMRRLGNLLQDIVTD